MVLREPEVNGFAREQRRPEIVPSAPSGDFDAAAARIKALGIPRDVWLQFGAFRNLGPGAYLVVIGGLMGMLGGVLTMAWAHNEPEPQDSDIA